MTIKKVLLLTLAITTSALASQSSMPAFDYYDTVHKIERRVMHFQYIKEKDFIEITIPAIERCCLKLGAIGATALPTQKEYALGLLYAEITRYQDYLIENTTPEGSPPLSIAPVQQRYTMVEGNIISRSPIGSSPDFSDSSPLEMFSSRRNVSGSSTPNRSIGASPRVRSIQSAESLDNLTNNWN